VTDMYRNLVLVLFLPSCVAKDADTGADGVLVGPGCEMDVTYRYPDGSESTVTNCEDFEFEASFEFDPDESPALRSIGVLLKQTTEADFECWIRFEQMGVCGPGFYDLASTSADVGATFSTFDCPGAPNDYEGEYGAATGYVKLTKVITNVDDQTGNFSGESILVTVAGDIAIRVSEDFTLSGTFSVTEEVTGLDAEGSDCRTLDTPPV
jgi:hypothetical protein